MSFEEDFSKNIELVKEDLNKKFNEHRMNAADELIYTLSTNPKIGIPDAVDDITKRQTTINNHTNYSTIRTNETNVDTADITLSKSGSKSIFNYTVCEPISVPLKAGKYNKYGKRISD